MRLFPWPSPDEKHRALLLRAQAGDREAFRALYLELYDPVARFVGRRARSRADAEDLVGRVFHQLLEHLGDIDLKRGSVRMFVLAMARNAVIDHARGRKEQTPIDDVAPVLEDERNGPLDALLQEERLAALRRAVEELPPDMRELLALRHGDGLKHQEIAEMLGESTDAVKQRLSRAQRALRDKLEVERVKGDGGAKGQVVDVRLG